jgi:hypothetical protein
MLNKKDEFQAEKHLHFRSNSTYPNPAAAPLNMSPPAGTGRPNPPLKKDNEFVLNHIHK